MVYWIFIFQKGWKKSQENNLFGDITRSDVNDSCPAALKTVLAVTVKPGEALPPKKPLMNLLFES